MFGVMCERALFKRLVLIETVLRIQVRDAARECQKRHPIVICIKRHVWNLFGALSSTALMLRAGCLVSRFRGRTHVWIRNGAPSSTAFMLRADYLVSRSVYVDPHWRFFYQRLCCCMPIVSTLDRRMWIHIGAFLSTALWFRVDHLSLVLNLLVSVKDGLRVGV